MNMLAERLSWIEKWSERFGQDAVIASLVTEATDKAFGGKAAGEWNKKKRQELADAARADEKAMRP